MIRDLCVFCGDSRNRSQLFDRIEELEKQVEFMIGLLVTSFNFDEDDLRQELGNL